MANPIGPFIADPQRAGLFLDFDGTLSEIVPSPADARPAEGVRELLVELAARYAVVAIVSGRSAGDLVEWLGPSLEIWGSYGAQRAVDGRVEFSSLAAPYAELIARVKDEAIAEVSGLDLPGVVVEDKGVMLGLHFRNAADPDRARTELKELAELLAERHGLHRHESRMMFELRPPADFTKAAVVLERARDAQLAAAAFIGDDRVDLPGFDALDLLAEEGVHALRVAVKWAETPEELLERADVVVEGPAGTVRLLRELL